MLNCPVICTLLIIEHKGHVSPENCQVFQEGSGTVDSKIQHNIPVTVLSYQRLVSISLGALGTSSTQMLKLLSPYMCVCMSICVCVCVCVCGREGGGDWERGRESLNEFKEIWYLENKSLFDLFEFWLKVNRQTDSLLEYPHVLLSASRA